MQKPLHTLSGFTLIELSLVLVIIGLIVGGVIGGKSLIDSSRLQKITADIKTFQTATNNFKLQYNSLPGDWSEPLAYFPSWTSVASGYATGNGNGVVDMENEGTMFFKHLSLTQLIPGSYHRNGSNFPIGQGNPAGSITNTAFSVRGINNIVVTQIRFAAYLASHNSYNGGSLNGRQAKNIDKKSDDGLPQSGKITSAIGVYIPAYTETCRNNYPLDTPETLDCILLFDVIR